MLACVQDAKYDGTTSQLAFGKSSTIEVDGNRPLWINVYQMHNVHIYKHPNSHDLNI